MKQIFSHSKFVPGMLSATYALHALVKTGDLLDSKVGFALCILLGVAAIIFFIVGIRSIAELRRNR